MQRRIVDRNGTAFLSLFAVVLTVIDHKGVEIDVKNGVVKWKIGNQRRQVEPIFVNEAQDFMYKQTEVRAAVQKQGRKIS